MEDRYHFHNVKIIILGDYKTGKTTFINKLRNNNYQVRLNECNYFTFYFDDTNGEEQFNSVSSLYYRNALGVILFINYEIESSLKNLDYWYQETIKYRNEFTKIYIVSTTTNSQSIDLNNYFVKTFEFDLLEGVYTLTTDDLLNQFLLNLQLTISQELLKFKIIDNLNDLKKKNITVNVEETRIPNACDGGCSGTHGSTKIQFIK